MISVGHFVGCYSKEGSFITLSTDSEERLIFFYNNKKGELSQWNYFTI
ncbi:hypothetical protein PRUB_b0726 [Pseudoalteromonas rubra]|uniref:Uncharacterized protein n=1 Tax=Pseudoalteromonas rubra TaxID=43658 RepID=A0A8T0C0K9_9GAMM|nr:hypothetical protein PRUB_b0726 [Pseudoalteromonas rubra]